MSVFCIHAETLGIWVQDGAGYTPSNFVQLSLSTDVFHIHNPQDSVATPDPLLSFNVRYL